MKRMCLLLVVQCFICAGASAQSGNPFELRWKDKGDSMYVYPTDTMGTGEVQSTINNQQSRIKNQESAINNQHSAISNPQSAISQDTGTRPQEQAGDLAVAEPEETVETPPPPAEREVAKPERNATRTADEERPHNIASPLVLLLLFGLVFVLLTWAVNLTPGLVKKIYRAAFNENFSALLLREHKFASTQYLYYLVYLVFFINGGIFLYFLSRYSGWRFGYEQSPLIVFIGFVCFVYLIRHVVLSIIGITFPVTKEVSHFSFNIILYNILLGLTLIPINLFLAFGPAATHSWMIIIGLAAIGIFYLLRQARGVMIGGHLISKNVFQFFVYLCTIEILPVLVLLKFFHN